MSEVPVSPPEGDGCCSGRSQNLRQYTEIQPITSHLLGCTLNTPIYTRLVCSTAQRVAKYMCSFYNFSYQVYSLFLKESCSTQALVSAWRCGFHNLEPLSSGDQSSSSRLSPPESVSIIALGSPWVLPSLRRGQPWMPTPQKRSCEGGHIAQVNLSMRSDHLKG
jgi:hypothetical protein